MPVLLLGNIFLLYKQYRNIETYKQYRNKISTLTKLSKINYYHNYFSNNINNMKRTWQGINTLINNKRRDKRNICTLKRPNDGSVTNDPTEIPNLINRHFATVGQNLSNQLPSSKHDFREYLKYPSPINSFYFDAVTPLEVEMEILLLPANKAHGLYSFAAPILKGARTIISKPLANIMNASIETGMYPSQLKHAQIVPIFKSDDKEEPGNYRPISLLSNLNRIFEKLMYNRLKIFIDQNNILCSSQYGFREGHSTNHALLDIVNKIQTNMDNNLFSCGVFIDLKKAFDTVTHEILLSKLNHYGVRGIINNWFSSYLIGRSQTTQIGNYISDKEQTQCGVPQGSVLGPLLFLIYVNDIQYSSNKLDFFLFADDTNLLYADKNLKSLETIVNKQLEYICDWLLANKLTLNIKKSNFVIFHPYQKRLNYKPNLKVHDYKTNTLISLEQKDYVKYLGILIDSNLSWRFHIDHITLKISKTIGIISRLRHFVPFPTLLNIYRSLIHPYILYGLSVWGQTAKTNLDKILILQKRALRLMFFATNREHAIPLFVNANVLPIRMLYYKTVSILMHDIANTLAPQNLLKMFTNVNQIHSHNTRSAIGGNYFTQQSNQNQKKNSFSRLGTKIWNGIPNELRNRRKCIFKTKINAILFQVLESEDVYVDVTTIISKIKHISY